MVEVKEARATALEIPELMNGDKLTRHEFERRYMAMPELKKAELLEGVVYMGSPVSFERHAGPHADLMGWLTVYRAMTPGVLSGDNGTVRLDNDNEPQPDAFLFIVSGGQAHIGEDGYLEGAPELAAEIAASSVSYDLHVKQDVYRRSGVQEYLVWRVDDETFDWFVLNEGRYERLEPLGGVLVSKTFPGLRLDAEALLRGDMARVLSVLQEGVGTAEHKVFVAGLGGSR